MTCSAQQQGDEMACGRCGLRWGVGDVDAPACLQHERRARSREGLPPMPARPLVDPARPAERRQDHETRQRLEELAGRVDYRGLLAKYMRHVEAGEGTTHVGRIGASGRGYFSGVVFSPEELAALMVCEDSRD